MASETVKACGLALVMVVPWAGCGPDWSVGDAGSGGPEGSEQPGKLSPDGGKAPTKPGKDGSVAQPSEEGDDASVGSDGVEDLRSRNGTRLKRITYDLQGTAGLLGNWHDIELGIDCAFSLGSEPLADGENYCMPLGASLYGYLDANCSEPLISAGFARIAPKFWRQLPSQNDCDLPDEIFELVPATSAVMAKTVYLKSRDASGAVSCTVGPKPQAGSSLFTTGDTVPRSSFVKLVSEQRSDGTPAVVHGVSEDGALFLKGIEARKGEFCYARSYAGNDFCIPSSQGSIDTAAALQEGARYRDSACTEPLITQIIPTNVCGAPVNPQPTARLVSVVDNRCIPDSPPAYLSLGPPFTGPPSYARQGMCFQETTTPSDPSATYYLQGARFTGELPALTGDDIGTGRLRLRAFYDDKHRRISTDGLNAWDDELKVYCQPRLGAGDKATCHPKLSASEVYIDGTCTRTALAVRCTGAEPGAIVSVSALAGTGGGYHRLGTELSNGASYSKVNGECVADDADRYAALFQKGEAISEDDLAFFAVSVSQ